MKDLNQQPSSLSSNKSAKQSNDDAVLTTAATKGASHKPLDKKIVALYNADDNAKSNFKDENPDEAVEACPLLKKEIYITPVRYAFSEQAASHKNFKPTHQAKSHPHAIRMLRKGYLYLWQDNGPLRRFSINGGGLLDEQSLNAPHTTDASAQGEPGFKLSSNSSIFLAYTEMPISDSECEALQKNVTRRKKYMREFSLSVLQGHTANDIPNLEHCLPVDESLVAQLMPEVKFEAELEDYQKNIDKYREEFNDFEEKLNKDTAPGWGTAWVSLLISLNKMDETYSGLHDANPQGLWSAETWNMRVAESWFSNIKNKSDQQGLQPWLLALDDFLGDFRDVNNEQRLLELAHEQWLAKNEHRTAIAGFIRSLMQEDDGELAERLNYQFRDRKPPITPEQAGDLLAAHYQVLELEKKYQDIQIKAGHGDGYELSTAHELGSDLEKEIKLTYARALSYLPEKNHEGAIKTVRSYHREKDRHVSNGLLDTQVAERVHLNAMNKWLDIEAPAYYESIELHHQLLYEDRAYLYEEHGNALWYADFENEQHIKCLSELAFNTLSEACAREQGIRDVINMLRTPDPNLPFSLLLVGWQLELGQLVSDASRAGELQALFNEVNDSAIKNKLIKIIPEKSLKIMKELGGDVNSYWGAIISKLHAAIIHSLDGFVSNSNPPPSLSGIMLILTQGETARFKRIIQDGKYKWIAFGEKVKEIENYIGGVIKSIHQGGINSAQQLNSVSQYGGVLPLAILGVNILNSISKAGDGFDGQDEERQAEQYSAYLYTGAALLGVMQKYYTVHYGQEVYLRNSPININYGFTALIGLISMMAASEELKAISQQIERAGVSVDPYLKLKRNVVTTQTALYGLHGVMGAAAFLSRTTGGTALTSKAIRIFRVGNPLIIAAYVIAGALYMYVSLKQGSPLQNFISNCCWGIKNAWKDDEDAEVQAFIDLLFMPKVKLRRSWKIRLDNSRGNIKNENEITSKFVTALSEGALTVTEVAREGTYGLITEADLTGTVRSLFDALGMNSVSSFELLSLDLPGASPDSTVASVRIYSDEFGDLGNKWLKNIKTEWIPYQEGQGIRVTANCEGLTPPIYVQVYYQNPLSGALSSEKSVGGEQGQCYRFKGSGEVTLIREKELPKAMKKAQKIIINKDNINMESI